MRKSAIITFLSMGKKETEVEEYAVEGSDDKVLGARTNDAPVKYLFQQSKQNGNTVDEIVCIVSREVYEERSSYSYFENMVKEEMDGVKIVPIEYDFQNAESGTAGKKIDTQEGKAVSVYNGISKALSGYGEVYIDYTGGFRDISFLMTVLIRYLEFTDVTCKDIVYSNFGLKKIFSLRYIYDMFKLLNAVSQFVETGSGKQLKEIYDQDSIGHKQTKELVECIYKFSNIICLCDVKKVDAVVKEMADAIVALEDEYGRMADIDAEVTDIKDVQVHMFRDLLQVIKKKFYIEGDNVAFTYPKLIKWCMDNGLWQQAITLYVEKMPIFYRQKGLVKKPSKECVNKLFPRGKRGPGETEEIYDFYTVLFEAVLHEGAVYKKIETFQNKVDELQVKSVEEVQKNCTDDIKKALERVGKKLKGYDKGMIDKSWKFCGIEVNAKSKRYFLNDISNKYDLAYAFICNETSKVVKFKKSLHKKVAALKVLSDMEDKDVLLYTKLSKDQLFKIMLYYFAIKFMRNQINHANETKEDSEDNKFVKKYFAENHIAVDIEVENISKILSGGLCLTNPELFE